MTLRHAVPAIFQYRDFAAAGGLMSYGGSVTDSDRCQASMSAEFSKAKSGPTPGTTGNQSRADNQFQDRQDPRPHVPMTLLAAPTR